MPWEWLLLGILDDSNGQATLQDIYICIEKQCHEIEREGSKLIDSRLFGKDLKYGNRPIYQHTVRGCLSAYKKRGLVEQVDRGIYRLTDAGLKHLKEY